MDMHTHSKDMLIPSCYGRRFKEAKKIKKIQKIRIQIWTDKRMARDSRLFDYKLHFPFLQIVFLNWLKRIVRHNWLSSDYEILQPICQYNKRENISRLCKIKIFIFRLFQRIWEKYKGFIDEITYVIQHA